MLTFKDLRKNLKIRREKPQIWLLEKEKVGYIQIPKVATRSIQHALVRHLVSDSAINDNAIDKELIKTIEPQYSAHMSLRRIRQDIIAFPQRSETGIRIFKFFGTKLYLHAFSSETRGMPYRKCRQRPEIGP